MILRILTIIIFALLTVSHARAEEKKEDPLKMVALVSPIPDSAYSGIYNENTKGLQKHSFTVNESERQYYAYAPKDEETIRPAIILLHGDDHTGASLVEKWKPLADKNNIVLIGPDGLNKTWNNESEGSDFFAALLNDAAKQYKIDGNRVYLFGHSRGATHALYSGIMFSQHFAAVAVHAGMFYDPEHYTYIDTAKRKIPFALMIGVRDHAFPFTGVKASARALAERGHPTTLYIIQEHNHWYYDIADFINKNAWEFLSQHSLGK